MAIERRGIQFTLTAENRAKGAFSEVQRQMTEIGAASNALRNTLAGLGVGLSLGGLVSFVKGGIDAAAQLDDLAEITGASVEELSKLTQVARISGTEFGVVESFLVKLNKALHTNAEEGKNARAALQAIGLSAEELRKLDPAEAMRRVAVELTKFADTGGKGAAMMALTGKSASVALPFLKDLATETGITARTTKEQAAASEELQKQLRRLSNEVTVAGQALAQDLVPWLNRTVSLLTEGRKLTGGFAASLNALTALPTFGSTSAEQITNLNKALADTNRLQKGLAGGVPGVDVLLGVRESNLISLIALAKAAQREQALALKGGDTPGESQRFGLAGAVKPRLDFETPGAPDKRFENALKQLEQEAIKVQELTRFEEVLADVEAGRYGKLTADQRQVLTNLAAQIDLSKIDAQTQKEVAAAMEAANKAAEALARSEGERLTRLVEKYEDLIDPLKRYKDQLLEIDELERKGFDSTKAREARGRVNLEMVEAQRRLNDLKKETQDTLDDMTEFSKQAARNIHDVFADNLFDLMRGDFDNLGSRFKVMLDRMVADALSAQLLNAIFGKDFAKTGNLGGLLNSAVGSLFGVGSGTGLDTGSNPREFDPLNTGFSLKSLLDFLPKFDVGTPYVPHDMYAKVHQGERILTAAENRAGDWGGTTIIMNVYAQDVRGFRESEGQIAASLMSRLGGRARRYS